MTHPHQSLRERNRHRHDVSGFSYSTLSFNGV
jgi:hypothetical protein